MPDEIGLRYRAPLWRDRLCPRTDQLDTRDLLETRGVRDGFAVEVCATIGSLTEGKINQHRLGEHIAVRRQVETERRGKILRTILPCGKRQSRFRRRRGP